MTNKLPFFGQIKEKLSISLEELPGLAAHVRMMPAIRRNFPMDISKIEGAKLSSVLLLLYPSEGKIIVPLIKRRDYDGTHSGQISFPGGKHENNESRIATALREAKEEIGVDNVEVIGTLTEIYIPPSHFKVLPVVCVLPSRPLFVKEDHEVAQIIEVDIEEFFNEANYKTKDMKVREFLLKDTPYFDIYGHIVWGATAIILSEMVEVWKNAEIL